MAALVGLAGPVQGGEWKELRGKQFTIVSDATDGEIRESAARLADAAYILDHLVLEDASWRKPLTVVLFSDQVELQPYLPLVAAGETIDDVEQERDTVTSNESGSAPDWYAIAACASVNYSREATFSATFGAVNWYLKGLDFPVPRAIRSGLGRVVGTLYRDSHHAILGQPPPGYRSVLYHTLPIPVHELLTERNFRGVILAGRRVTNTVESWALVHYLMFDPGCAARHSFRQFMDALSRNETPDQALVAALGPADASNIDALLREHVRGVVYAGRIPMPPEVENVGPITPADEATVQIALTQAALNGRRDSALAHVDAAIAAAPQNPECLALKAEALSILGRPPAQVRQAVAAAIARGSQDSWIYFSAARTRRREAGDHASPEEIGAIIRLAEHSAKANYNFRPAFDLIAQCLWRCPPRPNDSSFMNFARTRFPSDRWILVGQAAIARAHGDQERAGRLLAQAKGSDRVLSPSQLPDVVSFISLRQ